MPDEPNANWTYNTCSEQTCDCEGPDSALIFNNEAVTYFAAGSGTGFTYHDADNPRLLVALTPIRCHCGGDQDLKMSAGDVAWLPKGTLADISKTGNFGPHVVMVSFK